MNSNNQNVQQVLQIPTRNEFHRFVSNNISLGDFDTHHPPGGVQISKVSSALSWTCNNERWRFHG